MYKEEKLNQMFTLVEQWQQSGMSQVDFVKANKMKIFTLRYWINKVRHQQKRSQGIIQLNKPAVADIYLHYPNGVELLLPVHTPYLRSKI